MGWSPSFAIYALGLLFVRATGQASFSLVASVWISKVFGKVRGKALAVGGLGRALGEGSLPLVVTTSMALWGWRSVPFVLATFLIFGFLPLQYWLSSRIDWSKELYPGPASAQQIKLSHMRELYKDWRIYPLFFGNVLLPFTLTGLFWSQGGMAQWKGWTLLELSQGFIVYSILRLY